MNTRPDLTLLHCWNTPPQQEGNSRYRGILHAGVTIAREEGFRALFKGWLPSVIGVVPYVGLNFAVYETLKQARQRPASSRAFSLHPPPPDQLLAQFPSFGLGRSLCRVFVFNCIKFVRF